MRRSLSKDSKRLLAYFASTRALVLAVGILAVLYLPKFQWYGTLGQPLPVDMLLKWDAGWYLSIANDGYSFIQGQMSNAGYFPLYPLLIRVLGVATGTPLAAIIISHVALLAAVFIVYRLARLDFDDKTAMRAVLYLFIFPASLFFSAIYAEALFLLLSVASFYYARLGMWKEAGALGFLAALTRSAGLALLPALLLEYAMQKKLFSNRRLEKGWAKKLDRNLLFTLLPAAGTALFAAYLHFAVGDALAFVKAQVPNGGRYLSFPFSSFLELTYRSEPFVLIGLASALFGLALLAVMAKKGLRPSYILYTFIALLVPLSTGSLIGTHRYVAVLFPIFMAMAALANDRKAHYLIVAASACILIIYVILFTNGYLIT